MKIIIATGIFGPDIGGPATYVKKLAKILSDDGDKIEVVTYSKFKKYHLDKKNNYKVHRISKKFPFFIRYFLYYLKLSKISKKADLIYAQGPISSGFPAMLVKKKYKIPLVTKIVGDSSWEYAKNLFDSKETIDEFQKSKKKNPITLLLRKIQNKVVKNSDKIITPSNYLKGIVKGWGVKESNISIVYNSFKAIKIKDDKLQLRKRYNLNGKIIVSAGRLVSWKGFDILIQSLKKIKEKHNDAKLIIIGEGPEEKNLKELSKKLNLENDIIFKGKVSNETIYELFSLSDLFALNTGYEGLSHVIIEAMSCKLPIVTTNKGGNPELIKNGWNGFLVEYNDLSELSNKISEVLSNGEISKKFGDNSETILNKFDEKKMYATTGKILIDVSKVKK